MDPERYYSTLRVNREYSAVVAIRKNLRDALSRLVPLSPFVRYERDSRARERMEEGRPGGVSPSPTVTIRGLARALLRISGILAADSCSAEIALLTAANWRRVLAADRPTITAPSRPARRRHRHRALARAVASRCNATSSLPARKARQSIPGPAGRCSSTLFPRLVPRNDPDSRARRPRSIFLSSRAAKRAPRLPGATWRCLLELLDAPRSSLRSEPPLRV